MCRHPAQKLRLAQSFRSMYNLLGLLACAQLPSSFYSLRVIKEWPPVGLHTTAHENDAMNIFQGLATRKMFLRHSPSLEREVPLTPWGGRFRFQRRRMTLSPFPSLLTQKKSNLAVEKLCFLKSRFSKMAPRNSFFFFSNKANFKGLKLQMKRV